MSGGVWPPDGVTSAVPAERPAGPRSKPWLASGLEIPPPASTTQACADVLGQTRRTFADLGAGFVALGAAARAARDRLAAITAAFRDVDRPETGAPPP
ncbi:hypothetical protein NQK81_13390 [Amycolatopsis roodepoortensis]|uniref:hypothetical protein n=1 Tax=Amycolatopsis roodepoortensis TaxID=700274 RepID=UPI00214B82C5|nr:hypothetical protein [Amycolatopsis roodepoortensis]UUV34399.1 hypothetical protein NQK81_13390 [Amycolatopsis roodepoortensis]